MCVGEGESGGGECGREGRGRHDLRSTHSPGPPTPSPYFESASSEGLETFHL